MPLMETVTIINKSGKVVSTGKHLVNIFKDAKTAYNEKKAEIQAEQRKRVGYKNSQKLIQAREETKSLASSRHSHRSSRHHSSRHQHRDTADAGPSRPPLTSRNLSHIDKESVASTHRSRSSHHGPRKPRESSTYRAPFFEDGDKEEAVPGIQRRHTDLAEVPHISASIRPPPYTGALQRSVSNPDLSADKIDMNLAYGEFHPKSLPPTEQEVEVEVQATMSKLEMLLTEAQCIQHSVTQMITNLQANPEAMAAVALTLAELSSLLTKMSPSILGALKASSPAIFALLASPQFLIAGGVALGVTVVMFGGFKIIKKIQANKEAAELNKPVEALVCEPAEIGSIESWRRGIADVEAESVVTSVDGEFITPEAARRKKEHIRERAREERKKGKSRKAPSVVSERTVESEVFEKEIPIRSSSSKTLPPLPAPTESVVSDRKSSKRKNKSKELVVAEKTGKKSALSIFLNKHREKGKDKEASERSHSRSHRPKIIEMA